MSTHGKPSSSGDEPYYLIAAHSLLVDHDLVLANNFAQDDGRHVGADGLPASNHTAVARDGSVRSVHDVGLSVLVLPAYALGHWAGGAISPDTLQRFRMTPGRFAYSVVGLFLVVMCSIAAGVLAAALRCVTTPRRAAIIALVVTLCPPVLPFTFLVFPEAPAFVVVCIAVWLAYSWRARPLPMMLVAVGWLAIGLLPWFHRKFSFLALALLLGVTVTAWARIRDLSIRDRAALASAFTVPFAGAFVYSLIVWGSVGGPQLAGPLPFSIADIPTGAAGLLLDRSRGLLPYAPIYFLLPVIWWFAGRRFAIWSLGVAAIFVPMAAFVTWDAGYSPAARFLVPVMPLAALPVAVALDRLWVRRVATALLVCQLVLVGYAWNRPRALWPGEVGDNRLLNPMPLIGPALNGIFPVINPGTWRQ
jgi:hypothetical protein